MSAVAHGRVCSVIEDMHSNQDREAMNASWAAEYRANVQASVEANRAKLTPEQRAALDVAVARLEDLGDLRENLLAHFTEEEQLEMMPREEWDRWGQLHEAYHIWEAGGTPPRLRAHGESFSVTTVNQERSN